MVGSEFAESDVEVADELAPVEQAARIMAIAADPAARDVCRHTCLERAFRIESLLSFMSPSCECEMEVPRGIP